MTTADVLRVDGDRLLLEVYVAPRAARSRLAGLHDGRIKVQVAAPPVDGAANAELTRLLAKELELPRSAVELVRGASGRRKTLAITGLSLEEARTRLRL